MNIIVIGSGMYVSGRGTKDHGTILPAIFEFKRKTNKFLKLTIIGKNAKNLFSVKNKVKEISKLSGVKIDCNYFPKNNLNDDKAYLKAINAIAKPACAIVAVPDNLHFQVTKACLNKGLHTMVVKPLTSKVKEAKILHKLAQKNNLYGVVEFHKRWDKQNMLLKDTFRKGELGNPLYTWTEYSQQKIIPTKIFKNWVEKTNILQYLGIHYIDIVRFITGAIPKSVMAIGQKNFLRKLNIKNYDSIQSIINWKMQNGNQFTQTLITNWIDPLTTSAMSNQKIKFVGTKGNFDSDQKNRGISINIDEKNLQQPNPDFCKQYGYKNGEITWQGYGIDSINTFLKDVFDIVNQKQKISHINKIRPTFKEGIISTAVIESANKSLKDKSKWKLIKF